MINWRVGQLSEALGEIPDDTFHACLCDPPYGLAAPPPPDLLLSWLAGVEVEHGPGFLGRAWDSLPPGPQFWSEVYRVLRPGAIVMAFSHSRTFDLQGMAMRMAGFEMLPHFAWLHAESQALGADVSKLVDKAAGAEREVVGESPDSANRTAGSWKLDPSDPHGSTRGGEGARLVTAPATPLAQLVDGHHSRVRSNMEPILCAMKPIKGTWAENSARWGCAGFNVKAGRVPAGPEFFHDAGGGGGGLTGGQRGSERNPSSPEGRFPSLPLVEHSVECEVGACVPGCPAAVLAEQSGEGLTREDYSHTIDEWENQTHGDISANGTVGGTENGKNPESSVAKSSPDGSGKESMGNCARDGLSITSTTTAATTTCPILSPGQGSSTGGTTDESAKTTRRSTESSTGGVKTAPITGLSQCSPVENPGPTKGIASHALHRGTASGRPETSSTAKSTSEDGKRDIESTARNISKDGTLRSRPRSPIDAGNSQARFFFQARPSRGERSAGCGILWQRDAAHPDGWRIIDLEDFELLPERDRFRGNPHPALKSLELTRYLAKLLRQPGEARLIVPFSGSGSEAIGSMLGGWKSITAIEGSTQMVGVARCREQFWRAIMESGAEGSIKDLLGEHGPKKDAVPDDRQGSLFD